jgi:hypothetical protein
MIVLNGTADLAVGGPVSGFLAGCLQAYDRISMKIFDPHGFSTPTVRPREQIQPIF